MTEARESKQGGGLRRELGSLESYAVIIGTLIGAGIFKVISDTYQQTGPSGILGLLVLAPAILTTSVAYAVYLSTSLGREPGGEYSHISRTLGGKRIAFVGTWLKLIAYLGAGAYLANALAEYSLELVSLLGLYELSEDSPTKLVALLWLLFFYGIHSSGVRWIGRAQVWMCLLLGLSILVLVIPGLFAIDFANYEPFFHHGFSGFALSLPPLFFAFAGFESLAHAAGEVKDSSKRLPGIFLRGIVVTTIIFLLIAMVAFGVRPEGGIEAGRAPLAAVASVYLPGGAAALVAIGGVMAAATSLNASLMVPARIAYMLAKDETLPAWFSGLTMRTGIPQRGLNLAMLIVILLLVTDQLHLALGIAVFALFALYGLHSLALLLLRRRNGELYSEQQSGISRPLQVLSAWLSILSMGTLLVLQVLGDLDEITGKLFADRKFTTTELFLVWVLIGSGLYAITRRSAKTGS
ncbi:MAG: APC family permease [Planctomycetota bacterium]